MKLFRRYYAPELDALEVKLKLADQQAAKDSARITKLESSLYFEREKHKDELAARLLREDELVNIILRQAQLPPVPIKGEAENPDKKTEVKFTDQEEEDLTDRALQRCVNKYGENNYTQSQFDEILEDTRDNADYWLRDN